jgi:cytochrome b561
VGARLRSCRVPISGKRPRRTPCTPLIGENKDLAHQIEGAHEFIGNALYFLIGFHALAALAHHYLMKDNTLVRMLPRAR